MALLNWTSGFLTGNAGIDDQHRNLFDLINDFHFAYLGSRERDEVLSLLNALVRYAENHFQEEERLMSEAGYPELERHCRIHAGMFETIFELQEKFEAGAITADKEAVAFLRNWLTDHIATEDMAFGGFLSAGQEPPPA